MGQIGDDDHLALVWLEWRERAGQLEVGALANGRPVGLDGPVRNEAEAQFDLRIRRGLRERRMSRDHRIKDRQRHGRPETAEQRAPRQMAFSQERHSYEFLSMWGRMASSARLGIALALELQMSGPIDNRPQVANLPHKGLPMNETVCGMR